MYSRKMHAYLRLEKLYFLVKHFVRFLRYHNDITLLLCTIVLYISCCFRFQHISLTKHQQLQILTKCTPTQETLLQNIHSRVFFLLFYLFEQRPNKYCKVCLLLFPTSPIFLPLQSSSTPSVPAFLKPFSFKQGREKNESLFMGLFFEILFIAYKGTTCIHTLTLRRSKLRTANSHVYIDCISNQDSP